MKKVKVLLSTYNGYKYLIEQLESFKTQNSNDISILIRDDGSNDQTINILESLNKNNNISLIKGQNIGPAKSFFELLKRSSKEAEYFVFCDQDDVWEPDKISRAVEHLEKLPQDKPAMYFGRLNIVDENLNHIGYSKIPTRPALFKNALVENIATGASVVINKAARDLLITNIPENSIMHDWWAYLVVSAFGNMIYDEKPTIKYRQHGLNAVGMKVGFLNQFSHRFKRFLKEKKLNNITIQAQEFYELFGDRLDTENRCELEKFLFNRKSIIQRIWYAFTCKVYRQTMIDNFIMRVLIILNKI